MHIPLSLSRLAALAALAALLPSQTWQLANPAHAPSAREGHAMAWDAGRQLTVLFGGYEWGADVHFADTWEYDGVDWTRRQLTGGPSARQQAGMCYDEQRGVMVLFGGLRDNWFNNTFYGDTWEFDGVSWTQITTPNAPSPRFAPMAYDPVRGKVVLHGGTSPIGALSDTWEYDGANWTQRTAATVPPANYDCSLAFDRNRGRMVLQSSFIMGTPLPLQTWEWDGSNWSLATYTTPPPSYPEMVITYDRHRGVIVLVGAGYTANAEAWEYDGSDWHLLRTLPQNTLSGHALAYDERRGAVVSFGGEVASGMYIVATDATWELGTVASCTPSGAGCAATGPIPTLGAAAGSAPRTGSTFVGEVGALQPQALPVLALGLSDTLWGSTALPMSLGLIGLPACSLRTSVDVALPLTNTAGTATWSLPIPASPFLHGVNLFAQALVTDTALQAQSVSNAVRLSIGR